MRPSMQIFIILRFLEILYSARFFITPRMFLYVKIQTKQANIDD